MTKISVRPDGDRDVIITRTFDAAPDRVYRAYVDPALIRRWLLGPEGWSMPACEVDARPGGPFRYDYVNGERRFAISGEYVALEPGKRIVHVERMHLPDPTDDLNVETRFEPQGAGTLVTVRMRFATAEARRAMLSSDATNGMGASYDRLERAL